MAPRTTQHHAAITDTVKVAELLRAIDGYEGQPTTATALKLGRYVFVRRTELRVAEWSETTLEEEDIIRVISVRAATRAERKLYEAG